MLAYVFWHWPRPWIGAETYELRLIEFHRTLAAQKPPGFHRSFVLRLRGAPGLGDQQRGYADWYLVADSAALDPLDLTAVSGACREPHDRVAGLAGGGASGLYRLSSGAPDLPALRFGTWFGKPADMTYDDLLSLLAPWTDGAPHALWQRKMTLGPAPEFCLQTAERPDLPSTLGSLTVFLDLVWQ